ncbi:MAG: S-methyl-5-thioribose-1-phosphate isomerase [Planctomycetes bacterium]|nr:S-methyl-5-thioribose-1-phosphate isomerase [Planctomycetota bacterium]
MRDAIKRLQVRGAPAIGIAAAFGVVLGVRGYEGDDAVAFLRLLAETSEVLASARPTAVNLTWALNRMQRCAVECLGSAGEHLGGAAPCDASRNESASADRCGGNRAATVRERAEQCGAAQVGAAPMSIAQVKAALLDEAKRIRDEDAAMCRAIGRAGEPLIKPGAGVLTHCNAGGLATAEFGTALAPLYTAHELGRGFRVFADETRPLLQGSRLTAWELREAGIDVTLLCDSMAAALMREGKIDLVITGADRIAANGDVANKIGTYGVAVLAQAHGIPFYVAAPSSTFDLSIPDGTHIPIEMREADEIRVGFGRPTAPPDVPCYSPAFDVTPAALVRAIITERGIIQPVGVSTIAKQLGAPHTERRP